MIDSLQSRLKAGSGRDPESGTVANEPGRALALIAPVRARASSLSRTRPSSGFVAHLIATAQQSPQTREKRRADPSVAIGIYLASNGRTCPRASEILRA